ncbi:hypothetical protein GTO91_16930 [Heliobacterium undosum]|uniref:Uncharacterized protein n=1 Tax=Heliomicrobium undosum TaxID=121734 RepID=A0A845L6R3_9FIRM|nr:hypothetical protein [Heliomicrobium undosum]MZP31386.1 hypothetical protein [Heliomicrobium undosum]
MIASILSARKGCGVTCFCIRFMKAARKKDLGKKAANIVADGLIKLKKRYDQRLR